MKDEIKNNCPFKNNLEECQFCSRLGICYTDKQFHKLLDKHIKQIKPKGVEQNDN